MMTVDVADISLPNVPGQTCGTCGIAFMGSLNRIVYSRWFGSVVFHYIRAIVQG